MKTAARNATHSCVRSATNSNASQYRDSPASPGSKTAVMRLALILVLALACLPGGAPGATTGRLWSYFNLTSRLGPSWAATAMPGVRWEFARSEDLTAPARGIYFYELFVGPAYSRTWGDLTFKLPVWYYYTGYPSSAAYEYAHNIEFLPIINYRLGRLLLTSRTIFHNTVYASVYETSAQRHGYGLVIRQLFEATHSLNVRLALSLAEEPFFGVIEDQEAPPSMIGFWPAGFRLNRVYAGFRYQLTRGIALSPQYVLETVYAGGTLTDVNHYLFLTLSATVGMRQ